MKTQLMPNNYAHAAAAFAYYLAERGIGDDESDLIAGDLWDKWEKAWDEMGIFNASEVTTHE